MRYFVISIDTEADCGADWAGAVPESYSNLHSLQERLRPVLEPYGAPATLLLNGDIIMREGPSAVCGRIAGEAGWELGTHLHGEFVEPEMTHSTPAGMRLNDFQCGYGSELEFRKMRTLTELFRGRFGYSPESFRAGRFGAGPDTFRICMELGYEVDSSVVPGYLFREKKTGDSPTADFRGFDFRPRIVARNSERSLLEIPVMVRPGRIQPISESAGARWLAGQESVPGAVRKFAARSLSVIDRGIRPLHRSTWFRPSYSTASEMKGVLRWLAAQGERSHVVANMMFHSNELLPGGSPYNATEGDVSRFLEKISASLATARSLGYSFVTLAGAARAIKSDLL